MQGAQHLINASKNYQINIFYFVESKACISKNFAIDRSHFNEN
jgi:hypothetical protein